MSVQIIPRKTQAKPSQTKENGLDFLGFLRPNRDFSTGYGGGAFTPQVMPQVMHDRVELDCRSSRCKVD